MKEKFCRKEINVKVIYNERMTVLEEKTMYYITADGIDNAILHDPISTLSILIPKDHVPPFSITLNNRAFYHIQIRYPDDDLYYVDSCLELDAEKSDILNYMINYTLEREKHGNFSQFMLNSEFYGGLLDYTASIQFLHTLLQTYTETSTSSIERILIAKPNKYDHPPYELYRYELPLLKVRAGQNTAIYRTIENALYMEKEESYIIHDSSSNSVLKIGFGKNKIPYGKIISDPNTKSVFCFSQTLIEDCGRPDFVWYMLSSAANLLIRPLYANTSLSAAEISVLLNEYFSNVEFTLNKLFEATINSEE